MKLELSENNERAIFDQYPIIEKIGSEFFEVKLWILLKGMQSQTGENISVASLGHKPCHAMMKSGITYETIENQLKVLAEKKLIEISDPQITRAQRKFLVDGKAAYELNQLLNRFDLVDFIKSPENCNEIFKKLEYTKEGMTHLHWVKDQGKNIWFVLNNENGLFTSKLLKVLLWNSLAVHVRSLSESILGP